MSHYQIIKPYTKAMARLGLKYNPKCAYHKSVTFGLMAIHSKRSRVHNTTPKIKKEKRICVNPQGNILEVSLEKRH